MSVADTAVPTQFTGVWDELVMGLAAGFVLTDERGQVLATNDAAATLLRLDKPDLLTGRRPDGWAMRDSAGAPTPGFADLAGQALRTGTRGSRPLLIVRDDEPASRLWVDFQPVHTHGRERVLMFLQPVDTDVANGRGLCDGLTGLPGRALLLDRLEQALVRARSRGTLTTLVLIDVRRLAEFNAAHGFERGDELLCVIGSRLRQGMPDEYSVARFGGDEFAIVAEHPHGPGEQIAEQARSVASRPLRVEEMRVRPSVRVSWVTSDGHASVHSVIQHSEQQLG